MLLFLLLLHAKLTISLFIPATSERRIHNHQYLQILKHMTNQRHLGNNGLRQSSSTALLARDDDYRIGTIALSERWRETVANGGVRAHVSDIGIDYGVRLSSPASGGVESYEEFVEVSSSSSSSGANNDEGKKIAIAMNKTLSALQSNNKTKQNSYAVRSLRRGPFVAQLQLVRTLRPPPSPGFSGATSSTPPPYDPTNDSFLVGSLRLELRPLMGRIDLPLSGRKWDWYHNVSPADVRGHFLTLPSLSDRKNWRGQALYPSDCVDMCEMATLISPPGALLLGYNSVGGGASQNHIHVHAWPSPPLPFVMTGTTEGDNDVDRGGVVEGWNCYAASQADTLRMMELEKGILLELLDYPVCSLKMSASEDHVSTVGQSLHRILAIIGDLPHNVVFYNKPCSSKENTGGSDIVTIIFVRNKERSHRLSLKLGVSEMMGLFHCQSEKELETAVMPVADDESESQNLMELALKDVSADKDMIWDAICNGFVPAPQIPS